MNAPGSGAGPSHWDRVTAWIVRRRWPILALATAVTALSAAVSPTIETTSDPTGYLPKDQEEVRDWLELNDRFGAMNTLMVGLEEPSESLTSDGLARVARITDSLNELRSEGILLARSLTNVETLSEGEDRTLNAALLVPSIPRQAEDLDRLATLILEDMQVPGSLVSRDLKGYLILLTLDPRRDTRALAQQVLDLVEDERGPMEAYFFGAPFFTSRITRQVYAKLPWIVPIFAVLLFGVIFLKTRAVRAVLLVLFSSGLALVWWLGFMDLAGYALTMTSVNGLLLILVIGAITFARGAQNRLEGRSTTLPWPTLALLLGTLAAFAVVVIFGRLTPVSLPYLARFGEAMAIGMLALVAVGVLVFIPAGSFLSPWLQDRPEPCPSGPRRSRMVLVLVALATVGVVGSIQLRFATGLNDLFMEGDDVGTMLSFFDRRFGGNEFIQVDVKGDLRNPANCARLMRVTDLLEGSGAFADVRSITQVLGFLAHRFSGVHRIPGEEEPLNNLWFFLEGSNDVRPLVNDQRDRAMLSLRVPAGNEATANDLVAAVRWAIGGSAREPAEVAHLRLDALSRHYGVVFPDDRVDEAVSAAISPARQSKMRRDRVEQELLNYMRSPDAPFTPSDEEWSAMAGILFREGGNPVDKLAAGLRELPGFQASGMPSRVAASLAAMLVERATSLDLDLQGTFLTERLLAGMDPAGVPVQFPIRVKGVFTELLAAPPSAEEGLGFTVSGFPVIRPLVESRLLGGVWSTAAIVLLVLFLFLLAAVPNRRLAPAAAGEAVLATLLTFAAGWLTGIQVDSGSATLYLLPALVTFYLSPSLHRTGDMEVRRFPVAFALGLAAASLSLLITGVMPIMRIGAAMALGLGCSALVASVSRRLGSSEPGGPQAP